ncbi:MAG: 5'-nucleotidase C-terminal domain-containing protein [Pseudomonadota bacterium]
MNRIFWTSAVAFAASTTSAFADYTLHILHINDLHSRIESISRFDGTCSAEDDAAGECFGGVARLKSAIDAKRAELAGQNVILLDAGDQFQGSLIYTTYKGSAAAEFMEAMDFDAMAVGNHEFDDGPEALSAFIDAVSFPFVSSNLDVSQSNLLNGKVNDHVILEVGGEQIGIISALATDTVETSSPGPNVIFQDEIDALAASVGDLTEMGVSKIIALNHVGIVKDMEIANNVEGIDVVVGGHSHTLLDSDNEDAFGPYPMMVGDVPVVQAYAYSKYLGHLTVTFDDAGHLTSVTGAPFLIDAATPKDAAIAARVAELAAPVEEMKNTVVASAPAAIDGERERCRLQECAMGNLITDAMLDRVADQGIQIAIQNGGGIRASIDAGEVTMGEIYTVLPFQNTLSTFFVSGQTIIDALENGVSQTEEVKGRFPQVAGLEFTWDPSVAPLEGRVVEVLVEGAPIDPAATYGVVSNNYMRSGGDGYGMFGNAENVYDFGPDLAEVLAAYMAEGNAAPALEGRIKQK